MLNAHVGLPWAVDHPQIKESKFETREENIRLERMKADEGLIGDVYLFADFHLHIFIPFIPVR